VGPRSPRRVVLPRAVTGSGSETEKLSASTVALHAINQTQTSVKGSAQPRWRPRIWGAVPTPRIRGPLLLVTTQWACFAAPLQALRDGALLASLITAGGGG
jgi:hypothetical protein